MTAMDATDQLRAVGNELVVAAKQAVARSKSSRSKGFQDACNITSMWIVTLGGALASVQTALEERQRQFPDFEQNIEALVWLLADAVRQVIGQPNGYHQANAIKALASFLASLYVPGGAAAAEDGITKVIQVIRGRWTTPPNADAALLQEEAFAQACAVATAALELVLLADENLTRKQESLKALRISLQDPSGNINSAVSRALDRFSRVRDECSVPKP